MIGGPPYKTTMCDKEKGREVKPGSQRGGKPMPYDQKCRGGFKRNEIQNKGAVMRSKMTE